MPYILSDYGYASRNVEDVIKRLKLRLYENPCFPHEIGLFLGYPAQDVKEFIINKGQNCKFCGVWKVYSNEQESIRIFERFKKCSTASEEVLEREAEDVSVNCEEGREIVPSVALGRCIPFFSG